MNPMKLDVSLKEKASVVGTIVLGAGVILSLPALLWLIVFLGDRGHGFFAALAGVGLMLYGSFFWSYLRDEVRADWEGAKRHAVLYGSFRQ